MWADIFFVNKVPFMITLSRGIDFTAINHLPGRKASQVFKEFLRVYKFYLRRGFQITTVRADSEFAPLQELCDEKLPNGPQWSLATAGAHVPEIERRIRLTKERSRCIRHSLEFARCPKLLMIHIVLYVGRMLTYFPRKAGVSQVYSPRMIMQGRHLDAKKDLALDIGCYCEVP